MILNDKEIREKGIIEPFNEKQLTPNGYDVSVEDLVFMDTVIDSLRGDKDCYDVAPMTRFIISTVEKIKLPDNIVGIIKIKSKWARKGLIISDGAIDAGFEGKLNLCMWNLSNDFVQIEKKVPIVQVLFFKTNPVEKLYAERSGNYQHLMRVEIE